MVDERSIYQSPEARTAVFFEQEIDALADSFIGRKIAIYGSSKYIVVTARPNIFDRKSNSKGIYKPILEQEPGTLYPLFYPLNNSNLALVTGRENGQKGACIQITKAKFYDQESQSEKLFKNQKAIAEYLGLGHVGAQLVFKDESQTLFIEPIINSKNTQNLTTNKANDIFDEVFTQA